MLRIFVTETTRGIDGESSWPERSGPVGPPSSCLLRGDGSAKDRDPSSSRSPLLVAGRGRCRRGLGCFASSSSLGCSRLGLGRRGRAPQADEDDQDREEEDVLERDLERPWMEMEGGGRAARLGRARAEPPTHPHTPEPKNWSASRLTTTAYCCTVACHAPFLAKDCRDTEVSRLKTFARPQSPIAAVKTRPRETRSRFSMLWSAILRRLRVKQRGSRNVHVSRNSDTATQSSGTRALTRAQILLLL